MNKVSVLIAIYNAEKRLPRCLDSLLEQTLEDIQIICIDDASTDGSADLVRRYAQKDDRILLLRNMTNQGPSVARNLGFQRANAPFVTMLDSDDWLSPDALEKAVAVFEQNPLVDSVLFSLMYHDEESGRETPFSSTTDKSLLSGEEAFRLALHWHIHGVYVVRTELQRLCPYDETTRLYSDDNTSRRHYLYSRQLAFCTGVYYYRQHTKSATHSEGIRHFDWLEATASLRQMVLDELPADDLIAEMEKRLWMNTVEGYGYYFEHRAEYTPDERRWLRRRLTASLQKVVPDRLSLSLRCKFGYIPIRRYPYLYMCEAWLYFKIRNIYYGIKKYYCKKEEEKS